MRTSKEFVQSLFPNAYCAKQFLGNNIVIYMGINDKVHKNPLHIAVAVDEDSAWKIAESKILVIARERYEELENV